MRLIAGIDIERKYTFDEIMEMRAAGRLKGIAVQGYVVRADADGMIQFVPWHESTVARMEANRLVEYDWSNEAEDLRADVEKHHPMKRRTPQERVAAMVIRLMGEAKRTGTISGLTDAQIKKITGEAWKNGENYITESMVRKIAAHFLGVAEVDNRTQDSRRVTRLHPYA